MKVRKFTGSKQDWQLLHDICYGCGSESVKNTYPYIRAAQYYGGSKFICDIFDETGFFCGIRNATHVRVIAIAVLEHRKGFGRRMLRYEMKKAAAAGIHEITLRTSQKEEGVRFWLAAGAKFTGRKDTDWVMQIRF